MIDQPGASRAVFESVLQSGAVPEPQARNNLNCTIDVNNGVRYVECERDYETGDESDFYELFAGSNPMIYAHGMVGGNGQLIPHAHEDAHESYIYMNQEAAELCGYAKEYADAQSVPDDATNAEKTWMIVGIVFICLFAIAGGVAIYQCYKMNSSSNVSQGTRKGYHATGADDY